MLNKVKKHEILKICFLYKMKNYVFIFLKREGLHALLGSGSLAECGPQWRRQDGRGTSHRVALCLFVSWCRVTIRHHNKGRGRGGTPGDRPSSGCRVAEGGGLCSKKLKNLKISKAIKFQFLIKISKFKKLEITKAIKIKFLIKTSKS